MGQKTHKVDSLDRRNLKTLVFSTDFGKEGLGKTLVTSR